MTCPAPEALIDLMDDRGAAAASSPGAELRAHVAGCAACRAELSALQATFQALDPAALVTPPPQVLRRIERAVQAKRAPVRLWALALSAVALVLLLALPFALANRAAGRPLGQELVTALLVLLVPLLLVTALRSPRVGWVAAFALPWLAAAALLGAEGVGEAALLHAGCLPMMLMGVGATGVVLRRARRSGLLGRDGGAGLATGTAAAACGLALQVAFCHNHDLDHVALLHLLPTALLAGLGAALGWWSARRQGGALPVGARA